MLKRSIVQCCLLFLATGIHAQVPVSEDGKFVHLQDAKIYYEEFGEGEAVILLHGFGRTLEDWKPYIPALSKSFRVIVWDMRGHGRSTDPDTSRIFLHSTAANDLLAVMDELELEKVSVIGHSSGGIIALQAATKEPERFEAIIPISAQVNYSTQVREFIATHARPEDYYEFNDLEEQHGSEKGRVLARKFHHFHQLEGDPAITNDQLRNITARTLIVHGDDDFVPVTQAFATYQEIPGAHLWIVPNGEHIPHKASNKAEFLIIADRFLKNEFKSGPE